MHENVVFAGQSNLANSAITLRKFIDDCEFIYRTMVELLVYLARMLLGNWGYFCTRKVSVIR